MVVCTIRPFVILLYERLNELLFYVLMSSDETKICYNNIITDGGTVVVLAFVDWIDWIGLVN